jgi:hypothetical protein
VATILITERTVTKQSDSQKEYDASQLPFVTSTHPETTEPEFWAMVLDRELTDQEVGVLTAKQDSTSAFAYLQSLGGHPLGHAAPLENAPPQYREQNLNGRIEFMDTLKVSFLSTRSHSVIIDDWKAVDVTCTTSAATTVVAYPPQGGEPYQGIRLHLPPRPNEPVLTDDAEGQGEPYFKNRYIEVGGGQSAGALRVEAIAPRGQTCEWGVEVHYVDAHQKEDRVVLKDRSGNPLRLRTTSIPAQPTQKWVFGAVPWTACHENPQEAMCDAL